MAARYVVELPRGSPPVFAYEYSAFGQILPRLHGRFYVKGKAVFRIINDAALFNTYIVTLPN